jgi:uncharacterized protein (TIGR03083 family)
MGENLRAALAAWDDTMQSLLDLGEELTAEQWATETECPGWTVKDVYSHLVGGEEWMAAGHPPLEEGLAGITDVPVAARRGSDPAAVLAELAAVVAWRREQLAADPPDPTAPAQTAYGRDVPLRTLLNERTFDAWVHEQDVRRAVGRPGNLDSGGAQISSVVLLAALPLVVGRAKAPAGSVVRFTVKGARSFDQDIAVNAEGRARLVEDGTDAGPPVVTLGTDWETFTRLACGRIAPGTADVTITGDPALADRILSRLAVTP